MSLLCGEIVIVWLLYDIMTKNAPRAYTQQQQQQKFPK